MKLAELPLNARDTYQLLQLQPGVQSQLGNDLFYGSDKPGVVTVNGGRGRSNNYYREWRRWQRSVRGPSCVQPSPDTIEEFRVITNSFDAEYGRNSGAVVNVVTKSGTNDFHGSVFEFFRNKALNAQGLFDTDKLSYLQNQFGVTFGGPIKKDHMFFFGTYEGNRIRRGSSSDTVTVPTAQERLGNFASDTPFAGTLSNANILNNRPGCLSALGRGAPIADGTNYSDIFLDNQIPTACMDQTAIDLMNQFVPNANIGDSLWQGVPLGHETNDQFTVKVDQQLSRTQRLTGYYYFEDHYLAKPFARFQAGGGNVSGFGDLTDERVQQVNISHTWTIGSTAVNEARFTFFREGQGTFLHPQTTGLVQDSCKTVATADCFADPENPDLGIHPGLGASREGVPFISVSGGFSFGNNFEGELPQTGNTFQWSDNFSKTIGHHDIKFGGDFRYQQFNQTLYFDISGQYLYFGGGPNDVQYNNLFPNYLLGLADEYGQGSAQSELVRSKSFYLFAQDSWKLRPSLTLNYGLRWELTTPLADKGQKVQTFRPGQSSAIYPCQLSPISPLYDPGVNDCQNTGVTPVGLVVPGDKGVPNGLSQTYYRSFAPRIGLAWSPSATDGFWHKIVGNAGQTSIRAGFGLFYNPVEQLVLEQFSAEPPFGGSTFLFNTQIQYAISGSGWRDDISESIQRNSQPTSRTTR